MRALPSTFLALALLASACPGEPPPEPVVCDFADEPAGDTLVAPYLQSMTPTSVWILWETSTGHESRVDWGVSEQLGSTTCGATVPLNPELPDASPTQVHEVELTGLSPATTYHYRVTSGDAVGDVLRLRTPAEQTAEASIRLVAVSDSQLDEGRPDQLREVLQDGVLAFSAAEFGVDPSTELSAVLHAGDLVDNGWYHDEWTETFFAPGDGLFQHVPLYPVPGNHEGNSPHFFRYFRLPADGTPGFEEHWWSHDLSNVRLIGLDSNDGYRRVEQIDWLQGRLDDACDDPGLDFVFAQLHHPHRSEVWTPGNTDWTGEVIAAMEAFSTACGKPSIHFFGHTHAYSRGQSRDHAHLMVNVASAGGALDRWGEQPHEDYDEFSVSQDDYGFVVVEVEAGSAPQLRLRRISRGTPEAPLDNEVRDDLTIRMVNQPPATPTVVSTAGHDGCDGDAVLTASSFSDPDGDLHGAAHWQVAVDCDFATPLVDRWRQHENQFGGADTQEGDDLADEVMAGLPGGQELCWRVRYRDRGLAWSGWSEPKGFSTVDCGG